MKAEVAASLEALQFDYLDLVLIHWPNPDVPLADTLAALTDCREEGSVRQIGVSNFPSALLQEALHHAPIF